MNGARTMLMAPLAAVLKPPVRFTLVTTGRCGSELLIRALDSRLDTRCDGEVLQVPRRYQRAYVRGRIAGARVRGCRAYGCKLTAFTLVANPLLGPPEAYVAELVGQGFAVVTLRRRDLIRQALSHIGAREHGFHHEVGTAPRWEPLVVDPVDLLAHMAHVEAQNALLDRCVGEIAHLPLVYEDDLEPGGLLQVTADRVADFVGLPRAPVEERLRRATPSTLREIVGNWNDVERALRTTRFATLLEPSSDD